MTTSGSERPTKLRPRRDEILDAATQLFAERGYEGASMGDLAERVGLRKASLFHHFPSKDALYAAVLERLIQAVGTAITTAAVTGGSYAERLDALSDAITLTLGEQHYAARLLVREAMDWGTVVRERLAVNIMDVLGAAEQFIIGGQNEGVFVNSDSKQLLISLIGIHFMPFAIGGIVQTFTKSDPFDPVFVDARRREVRVQARLLIMRRAEG